MSLFGMVAVVYLGLAVIESACLFWAGLRLERIESRSTIRKALRHDQSAVVLHILNRRP
jgi:hypothetical protein